MAFFPHRTYHQKWWLAINWENSTWTIYQHGDLCYLLTIGTGIGPHSSGGTYGSLFEWQGNRKYIEHHLELSGAHWFLPFFEKGINILKFDEQEVLREFERHYNAEPQPVRKVGFPSQELTTLFGRKQI